MNLKIVGVIWMVSAVIPAVKRGIELWLVATHQPNALTTEPQGVGFWIAQFLVEVSFALILLTGWGLFRLRRWAVVAGGFLGVISLVVCVWFILTQGMQHGPEPYVAIWCGVALSFCTMFGVWKFRGHLRLAEQGAAPNEGAAAPADNSSIRAEPPAAS